MAKVYAAVPSGLEVHNVYGPTEGSMTWYRCPRGPLREVLIGCAVGNTTVLLLDEDLQPVADGQPGEVCPYEEGAVPIRGRWACAPQHSTRAPSDRHPVMCCRSASARASRAATWLRRG